MIYNNLKLLFLDFDGVMCFSNWINDTSLRNEFGVGVLDGKCVSALCQVLDAVPDLNVVISSGWRRVLPFDLMRQFLAKYVRADMYQRVLGYTSFAEGGETPQSRQEQIIAFCINYTPAKAIVVDDFYLNFPASIAYVHSCPPIGGLADFLTYNNIINYFK